MKKELTFQFDPKQSYQLDAISSVVDLFGGIPYQDQQDRLSGITKDIVANFPEDAPINELLLKNNLQFIQQRNNDGQKGSQLEVSNELAVDDGMVMEGVGNDSVRIPHFTIEMETGTGKTYTYLRTIHELKQRYGFVKFIIVVPSVAIYQGVIKSIEVTKNHFRQLYDNQEITLIPYDSHKLSELKTFAANTELTVLLMTIDACNKSSNNIYKHTEKLPGEWKPYQYVQATRPILILDEAQNFESGKSKEALRTLKPLFVLRYSATHRETPNLVYRLTPLDASHYNLVKQIEVVGVSELDNLNERLLRLMKVTKKPITAIVKAMVLDKGKRVGKEIVLKQGDHLVEKTKNPEYEGFIVAEIRYGKKEEEQIIRFENDTSLSVVDSVLSKEGIFRAMIERTIVEHMERQQELKGQNVKVLSLFFIDRVKNYTAPDGVIRRLFDESFERLKHQYLEFQERKAEDVRRGYFAKKSQDDPDEEAIDTEGKTQAQREMEKQAFELIMKNKERLLSFDEPVSFIFAHSALKEGWDNPNVCQICTLNQTNSIMKKRQEIGRGLRLLVDQEGKRLEDHTYNILTVIANESYEAFVSRLQEEYIEDGVQAPPRPGKSGMSKAKRRGCLYHSKEFRDFWSKFEKGMTYSLRMDTEKLIQECVERLNAAQFPSPFIEVSRGSFVLESYIISMLDIAKDSPSATIRIQIEDTQGNRQDNTIKIMEKDNLKKMLKDERLRGFKVLCIGKQYGEPFIQFGNEVVIKPLKPHRFTAEKVEVQKKVVEEKKIKYPIPDFISRTADETYLTKKTILEIFKRMDSTQKEKIFYNPEGWISEFLSQIRTTLSDHIAENTEFEIVDDSVIRKIDTVFQMFSRTLKGNFPEQGRAELYSIMGIDPEGGHGLRNEPIFLDSQEDKPILYFKFPPRFRMQLPRVIDSYDPVWAMVRKCEDGLFKIKLVREIKGDARKQSYSGIDRFIPAEMRK